MQDTLQILTRLVAEKLETDPLTIGPDSTFEQLGLDSLDTFDLIFSAEDAFKIKVPNEQVVVKTLRDVVELVDRLVKEQHPA